VFVLSWLACNGPEDSGERPIDVVVSLDWTLMQPDPLDPEADCDEAGVHEDAGVIEVDTNLCGWATLSQPSMGPVHEGESLDLLAWHSALASTETGEQGVMWLELGGERLFSVTKDIPSSEEVFVETVELTGSHPSGSEVRLHVHNHGGNSWSLAHLRRR
jgi:hypothetical protein